ncbi:uncharacterized protein V1516DRAFT_668705 [Lipomyces oligophaga]|uniref:uncharacterized protein n=1 Tax=Lipomyces oligophaga TaxID=45792 RepID=UPI0034CD26BC
MRIKLKLPSGQAEVITLGDTVLLASLLELIRTHDASLTGPMQIKVGFPPKNIDLSNREAPLFSLGVRSGDQLTIICDPVSSNSSQVTASVAPTIEPEKGRIEDSSRIPEVPCGDGNVVVLRVMEDDNSCLFRAIGYALLRDLDTMHELRSIVASAIEADPVEYSDAVLGRKRDEYCEWIQRTNSWGGAIEISILALHFGITIRSLDVATGRIDSFNEGQPTFVLVVYSGIHYDAIALAPEGVEGVTEFDQTVFENDEMAFMVMEAAESLGKILKERRYYTDTASFSIQCSDCGAVLTGERGAEKHSESTGHVRFQETA